MKETENCPVCMILSLYMDAFKYDVSCFACNKYYQIPDDPPAQDSSIDVVTRSTQVDQISESQKITEKFPKKLTLLSSLRRDESSESSDGAETVPVKEDENHHLKTTISKTASIAVQTCNESEISSCATKEKSSGLENDADTIVKNKIPGSEKSEHGVLNKCPLNHIGEEVFRKGADDLDELENNRKSIHDKMVSQDLNQNIITQQKVISKIKGVKSPSLQCDHPSILQELSRIGFNLTPNVSDGGPTKPERPDRLKISPNPLANSKTTVPNKETVEMEFGPSLGLDRPANIICSEPVSLESDQTSLVKTPVNSICDFSVEEEPAEKISEKEPFEIIQMMDDVIENEDSEPVIIKMTDDVIESEDDGDDVIDDIITIPVEDIDVKSEIFDLRMAQNQMFQNAMTHNQLSQMQMSHNQLLQSLRPNVPFSVMNDSKRKFNSIQNQNPGQRSLRSSDWSNSMKKPEASSLQFKPINTPESRLSSSSFSSGLPSSMDFEPPGSPPASLDGFTTYVINQENYQRNQTIPVVNNQRKLNSIERLAVEPQRKKRRYTKRKVDKRLTKRQFYFRHCGQCMNKFEEMNDQSSVKCDNCRKWYCNTCAPASSYASDGKFWCTQCKENCVVDKLYDEIWNCPNDWCTYFIDISDKEINQVKLSMKRHAKKCTEMFAKGLRLVHYYGKVPNRYVSIADHGLALDQTICKTERID